MPSLQLSGPILGREGGEGEGDEFTRELVRDAHKKGLFKPPASFCFARTGAVSCGLRGCFKCVSIVCETCRLKDAQIEEINRRNEKLSDLLATYQSRILRTQVPPPPLLSTASTNLNPNPNIPTPSSNLHVGNFTGGFGSYGEGGQGGSAKDGSVLLWGVSGDEESENGLVMELQRGPPPAKLNLLQNCIAFVQSPLLFDPELSRKYRAFTLFTLV